MRYSILGTGEVARNIGAKLISLGHEVMLGGRSATNEKAKEWADANGDRASHGTFADAACFGERIFLSVRGMYSLDVIKSIDPCSINGKILIDQTNPYKYEDGQISILPEYSGTTCLGEEVQNAVPNVKVVKTLNYISSQLMTNPQHLSDDATGFYCGNDAQAKSEVAKLLADFGWVDTMDLGNISMARYTEMLGAFWPAVYGRLKNMDWGFKLIR